MAKSYGDLPIGNEIDDLLNDIELRGISGYKRHIYRNQAFDYAYGVRDKNSEEHPFSSVLKSPEEPYYTTTPHQEMLKVFIYYQLGKNINLDYHTFLTLPYPIAIDCIDECKALHESREREAEKRNSGDLSNMNPDDMFG